MIFTGILWYTLMKTAHIALCAFLSVFFVFTGMYLGGGKYNITVSYPYPAAGTRIVDQQNQAEIKTQESADFATADADEAQSNAEAEIFINLNLATKQELMQIPRIGEVLSARIIDYRTQIGGYTDLNQLKNVEGIADKMFGIISQYLYI